MDVMFALEVEVELGMRARWQVQLVIRRAHQPHASLYAVKSRMTDHRRQYGIEHPLTSSWSKCRPSCSLDEATHTRRLLLDMTKTKHILHLLVTTSIQTTGCKGPIY